MPPAAGGLGQNGHFSLDFRGDIRRPHAALYVTPGEKADLRIMLVFR